MMTERKWPTFENLKPGLCCTCGKWTCSHVQELADAYAELLAEHGPSKAKPEPQPVRLHQYVNRAANGSILSSCWTTSVDGGTFERVVGGMSCTGERAMAVAGWNGEFSK